MGFFSWKIVGYMQLQLPIAGDSHKARQKSEA
jgi:hypothetical protein